MSEESNNNKDMIVKNDEINIPIKIGPYTNVNLITETRRSIVIRSIDTNSRKKLAIKYIPYKYFQLNPSQIQIMQSVNDPRIIEVLDSFEYPNQNPEFVAIVMPMAVCDLFSFFSSGGALPEPMVCKIMRDLCQAVDILHSNNIWHRNLKPENILVMAENKQGPTIAITDFCSSIVVNTPTFNGPVTGTYQYAAPELLEVSNGRLRLKNNADCLF